MGICPIIELLTFAGLATPITWFYSASVSQTVNAATLSQEMSTGHQMGGAHVVRVAGSGTRQRMSEGEPQGRSAMAKVDKPKIGSIVINIPEELLLKAVKEAQHRNIDTRAFVSEVTTEALQNM